MNTVSSRFISLSASARVAAAMLTACVVLAGSRQAAGQVNNSVQTTIPAFYQHQGDTGTPMSITPSADPIWNPDGGWCAYVSYLDALYPWETLTVGGVHPFDNANAWLFGAPGGGNPGTGTALTTAGTWLSTADNTVIPDLVNTPVPANTLTLNAYFAQQKVDPGNLGLLGLVDTLYQTLPNGQVQVWTGPATGWKNITPNTFALYQQLATTGSTLPAALQSLAAITTTVRINYTPTNSAINTGFWWNFHQLAGAGVAGPNTIQYSDPDAIPINAQANGVPAAVSRNGGNNQAGVNANQYDLVQQPGMVPLPGNTFAGASAKWGNAAAVTYATNNLYSTMQVNAMGQITGGNGPYANGLPGSIAAGATPPVTRITNIEAISLPAAQLLNLVVGPLYDASKFLFSGNFGGDVSKLEIFPNSPLYTPNLGLTETDPNWGISEVTTDPFGNNWAGGGVMLSEGAGGSDLMEDGSDYDFTEDTTSPVTGWTVFAYDQADGYWLTETYGDGVAPGYIVGAQAPEPSTCLLMATGVLGLLFRRRRSPLRV